MGTRVIIYEKLESGELSKLDERTWTENLLRSLEHANYITINKTEYEMVEGRLNIDEEVLEILVISSKKP
ncbi:hypothetical protein [Chengkuizengella axinellae]|uniref:Uncharacterized protein n=1 Tax=Chengkuizengella axinellae TaxID=3064388 RepID=A0ABT9IZ50_9BACL|nr:hypothetical protein [Chengkuizengella sp. 2205SS18-9]MDP5274646.1 hypothetical protein [Chengkuizengella sp. 2205SS18-9]